MGFLDRILGNDHERAARYEGRESATQSAARARRDGHRNGGANRAARDGQAWEDADRGQDRRGTWYRPAR
jgi:hypothetical protein